MLFKHNDYEIIKLIREGDIDALQLMFEKYSPLIYKKIHQFNLAYEKEDMYQEGLMLLNTSIKKFDAKYGKSFTRYFELNLNRKLISIVSQRSRRSVIFHEHTRYIFEQSHSLEEHNPYHELYVKEISKILTKTENLVYTLRELKNYSNKYIKDKHGLTDKIIYNSMYRAKIKIKSHFTN